MEAGRGPRDRRLPDRAAHPARAPGARSSSAPASPRLPPARRRVSSSSPTSRRRATSSSATGSTRARSSTTPRRLQPLRPRRRASGPDPHRRTYASFATFSDPDGNHWQLQEITTRLPGRVDARRRRSAPPAISRARCGVRRPPTASTRPGPARRTRTGPTGTPRTWWRSRPATSCRRDRRRQLGLRVRRAASWVGSSGALRWRTPATACAT